jgi:hypothetical protein
MPTFLSPNFTLALFAAFLILLASSLSWGAAQAGANAPPGQSQASPGGQTTPAAGAPGIEKTGPAAGGPASSTTSSSATPGATGSTSAATTTAAQTSQPVIVLPATTDEAQVTIVLHGMDAGAKTSDIVAGDVVSTTQPGIVVHPDLTFDDELQSRDSGYLAKLHVKNLIAFGESNVPLLYKGRQIELLRFSKPGLVAKPAGETGFVAREGDNWPIVLENLSGFEYKGVKARLRFADTDGCAFDVEIFSTPPLRTGTFKDDCNTFANWADFDVPKYAQVTLRARSPDLWFRDPTNGFARPGRKKGSLTLRFRDPAGVVIHEQSVPIEVQFEPSAYSVFWTLLWVAMCLSAGAVLSLLLRVWLPNVKRNRQLKDQLDDLAKQTSLISSEVDSNLRVLLRVERIALNEVRLTSYAIWPGFVDYAQRVEQGLPTLKKRIDAVKRLDAALTGKNILSQQGAAPTRLLQIESQLDAVSETLKQEQLSDEEWVFVSQRLEAALKTLREPTQAEKDAFDASLVGTWKIIRQHFDLDPDTGTLKVPAALKGTMDNCFPSDASLLPKDDEDASGWVRSFGTIRADLQLSALKLVMDFQFLAPAVIAGSEWETRARELSKLLATPAINNLNEARSLLRQYAERVSEDDIVKALQEGKAEVIIDPANPRPNQKIRYSVRFLYEPLNSAAAKGRVRCSWTFRDNRSVGRLRRLPGAIRQAFLGEPDPARVRVLKETGWYVHHYFEGDVYENETILTFYDSGGEEVRLGNPPTPPGPSPAGPPTLEDSAEHNWAHITQEVAQGPRSREEWSRGRLEFFQLVAALLVPLATMASSTISGGGSGHWWELVAIGFGADTIKSILTGQQTTSTSGST